MPQAPDTPGSLTASATLNSIALGWAAPFDGGSAITKYIVELKGAGTSWSTVNGNVAPGATSLTINNLVSNTTYTYRITAVNAIGNSLPGQFAAVKIPGTPAAPTNLKATAGVKSAVLTWTPPADVAGAPITKWQITWGTSNQATGTGTVTINGSVATSTYTVPGLTKGQKLFFRVAAINGIGTGGSVTTAGSVTIL
jgi:predicted phage tail protein